MLGATVDHHVVSRPSSEALYAGWRRLLIRFLSKLNIHSEIWQLGCARCGLHRSTSSINVKIVTLGLAISIMIWLALCIIYYYIVLIVLCLDVSLELYLSATSIARSIARSTVQSIIVNQVIFVYWSLHCSLPRVVRVSALLITLQVGSVQ